MGREAEPSHGKSGSAHLLSDEVWRQLDPQAGRLPRRTVLRLRRTLAAMLAVSLLVGVAWRSGFVVPRLEWPRNAGYGRSVEASRIEFEVWISNDGWTSAEVLAIGRSGPGFVLENVRAQLPTTLGPGEQMNAVLIYRVTDCAAVPADVWPVPVTVRRFWGTATGYVQPPTEPSPAAPQGSREYTGRDPYAVEWQRGAADLSCSLPRAN